MLGLLRVSPLLGLLRVSPLLGLLRVSPLLRIASLGLSPPGLLSTRLVHV